MKNIFKIAMFGIFAICLLLFSCEKKKLAKFENDWRLIRVDSLNSQITWYETWQMHDGKIKMLKRADGNESIKEVSTGEYSLKTQNTKTFVTFDSLTGDVDLNGKWQILKLNDEILTMVREKPLWKYREFVKE